jgi:hypothetical protein
MSTETVGIHIDRGKIRRSREIDRCPLTDSGLYSPGVRRMNDLSFYAPLSSYAECQHDGSSHT